MSDRVRIDPTTVPIEVLDGDNFTVDVRFEDRATETPLAPGTVHYRIDCLTTDAQVQDWTEVDAGESVSIALASAYSAILDAANEREIKQITVTGDKDATYQCSGRATWTVRNRDLQS